MAHKTNINGSAYAITGGKVMVDGTVYDIAQGKTLVDGVAYDISLSGPKVTITFVYGYNADLTFAAVNGATYGGRSGSPGTETVEVEVGTEITFSTKTYNEVYGSWNNVGTFAEITLDGTRVTSGHQALSYSMVVNGDITVSMDRTTSQGTALPVIAITT